jgi:hypothetical protein
MDHWLLPLLLLYFAIGLVVYARTDTADLAAQLESRFVAAPAVLVLEYVFFGVVTFWPLWVAAVVRRR